MAKITLTSLLFLLIAQFSQAQINHSEYQVYTISDTETYTYKKPKIYDIVTCLPKDLGNVLSDMVQTENLMALGTATFATTALIPADQTLLDNARSLGERIGLNDTNRYKNFGPLSNIPSDISSGIYLIGNGTTPILLSMGFATYGLINNDYRSLNTATGLIESLAVSGVFSQSIKRITGRESPTPAIENGNPGGAWRPFPSFAEYGKNTPSYDAMPSGHLMTATAALYVISGNYPEVQWIKPVGFVLIGVLSYEMVQSRVHWVSDYPIALVMGYLIGKNIAQSKIKKSNTESNEIKKYKLNFSASRTFGYNIIGARLSF